VIQVGAVQTGSYTAGVNEASTIETNLVKASTVKVRLDIRILLPPPIPRLHPLLHYLQVLRVGH
jgi:hypothetical protein